MKNCEYCNTSFEPKRAHARTCSSKCRVALARKEARKQMAEEGSPDVEWVDEKMEPEYVDVKNQPYVVTDSESCKKLPVAETPLRADTNSLARQVIQNMKAYKAPTVLEMLEKSQLKK